MINVVRVEKQLYRELSDIEGYLGRVEQIYNRGFHITSPNTGLIYFQGENWLQSPFSIALDVEVDRWMSAVSLYPGDDFSIGRGRIYSSTNRDVLFSIDDPKVVDLSPAAIWDSHDREAMGVRVREIAGRVLLKGRSDGLLRVLGMFGESWPELNPPAGTYEKPNLWSGSALPGVTALVRSSVNKDPGLFEKACDALIGLGPGLTPSGDDLLVGFLAVQERFASPIRKWLYDSGLINRIIGKQKGRTTTVSLQFLKCAAEGRFSETLLKVIDGVMFQDRAHAETEYAVIDDFLGWGHTSGTDTLVGVVVALSTLTAADGKLH
jgi:hypothetical protein